MSAIKVIDYDPAWPGLFEEQKRRIMELIGDMVKGVHHVGSTSIAGLCAKPKIDIHAVLRSDPLVAEAVERVKFLGDYTFHGEPYADGMLTFTQGHGSYGTRLYFRARTTRRMSNGYCSAIGSAHIRTMPPTMPH